jgi:hypothetical protein
LTFIGNEIYLEPIIARVLVTRYYPEDITVTTIGPITLEGEQESDAAVVYPDGTVRMAHDCSFQTVESWKEDGERWIEERRKEIALKGKP